MTDKPSSDAMLSRLDRHSGLSVQEMDAIAARLRELKAENNKLRATVVVADAERDGLWDRVKELEAERNEARAEVERLRAENNKMRKTLNSAKPPELGGTHLVAPDPLGEALNSGDGTYKP